MTDSSGRNGRLRDFYARRLIKHVRTPGLIRLALAGSDARLLRKGKISQHRRIESFDGTIIDAWVVSARNVEAGARSRGTVLLIHGLWDSKACWLAASQVLADRGFDVVLSDLRAHGHSTGDTTTWGALEKLDLKMVIDTLVDEAAVSLPLYVAGFSMGGGLAVQYAAFDNRCRGVLAVSAVASARRSMRRLLFLWAPWKSRKNANDTIIRAGEIAGFDVEETSAVRDVAKLDCPVFQIHGRLDKTVPIRDGRMIYEAANEPKEFECVWWGPHEWMLPFITDRVADAVERMHELNSDKAREKSAVGR